MPLAASWCADASTATLCVVLHSAEQLLTRGGQPTLATSCNAALGTVVRVPCPSLQCLLCRPNLMQLHMELLMQMLPCSAFLLCYTIIDPVGASRLPLMALPGRALRHNLLPCSAASSSWAAVPSA